MESGERRELLKREMLGSMATFEKKQGLLMTPSRGLRLVLQEVIRSEISRW